MVKEHSSGIIILFIIIAIAAFGGNRNAKSHNGSFSTTPQEPTTEQKIVETKNKIDTIQKQIQVLEDAKTQSKYKDVVSLRYVNRSTDSNNEYVTLYVSGDATSTIPITGWQIKSLSSGNSVTIPSGTQLFFSGTTNTESPIILYPRDTVYIITGVSPNGSSFRINKCSGYLSQFQTFIPYISTSCPSPRNENLSSIPNRIENNACFDYIDSFPSCRTQTENLPNNWSYECKKFIAEKINYSSCIDTHKNDTDFYQKEWRVYLKRSSPIWQNEREKIVLYDTDGKVVDTLKY